jgi:hypothetical protein
MKLTAVFVIILFFAQWSLSQDQTVIKYSNTITKDDLKKHLSIIASDEYQGRNTGDKGLEMTAKYIENAFQNYSVKGIIDNTADSYYQEFELEKKSWPKLIYTADKVKLEQGKNIAFLSLAEGVNEYEVIFAGYGIFSDKYNDYKDIDVKNKVVVFLADEPKNKKGIYLATGTQEPSIKVDTTLQGRFNNLQSKIMAVMMRGAKGFIVVEMDDNSSKKMIEALDMYFGGPQMNLKGEGGGNLMPSMPMLFMSPSAAAAMFGTTVKKMQKTIEGKVEKGESCSGLYNAKIKIEAEKKSELIKTGNVVGFIEGSDKKDEYLVLMAHYDHMGTINGVVYNGADDNGSGTSALLEMAEAFSKAKAEGNGPLRSIVFIALTGEEKGLLGSKYYTNNPILPIENAVTGLNIDMIGRIDKKHTGNGNYIYIIGDDRLSTELHTLSENTSKLYYPDYVLDYELNAKDHPEHLYERSDHYNFAQKGVPVIFYTSGEHDQYHKPEDDVALIDFTSMEKRVRAIFATAWQLANMDERVKKD